MSGRAHDTGTRQRRDHRTAAIVAALLAAVMIGPNVPAAPLGAGAVPTDGGPRDGTGGVADLPSGTKVDVMMESYAPGGLPTQPAEVAIPEKGIGPGSELRIAYPDGSGGGCTANFVWEDPDGALYLGTAGHCVLPGGATATHGPGADYNTSRIEVSAAAEGCRVKPSTFVAEVVTCTTKEGPVWIELGEVAYARQTHPEHGAVGHDFALVEIPEALHDRVRVEVPYWGGPDGTATMEQDDDVLQYGHGLGWAALPETRRRAAKAVGRYPLADGWMALGGSNAGDSGGPVVLGDRTGDADLFRGREAAGILTHGIGVGVASPIGAFLGTDVDHARWEARCFAGLSVRVVPNGSFPGDPGADCPDACPEDCGSPGGDDGTDGGEGDGGGIDVPTVYLDGAGNVTLSSAEGVVRSAHLVANASFAVTGVDRPNLHGTGLVVAPAGSGVLDPDRCTNLPDGTTGFFGPPSASGRLWSADHPAGDYVVRWTTEKEVDVTIQLDRDGPTRVADGTANGSARFTELEVQENSGSPSRATFETNITPENASVLMADFYVLPALDGGIHRMRQNLTASRTCEQVSTSDVSVSTPATWVNAPQTWLAGVVPGSATATWSGVYEQTVGVWKPTDPVIDEAEARGVVMDVS